MFLQCTYHKWQIKPGQLFLKPWFSCLKVHKSPRQNKIILETRVVATTHSTNLATNKKTRMAGADEGTRLHQSEPPAVPAALPQHLVRTTAPEPGLVSNICSGCWLFFSGAAITPETKRRLGRAGIRLLLINLLLKHFYDFFFHAVFTDAFTCTTEKARVLGCSFLFLTLVITGISSLVLAVAGRDAEHEGERT